METMKKGKAGSNSWAEGKLKNKAKSLCQRFKVFFLYSYFENSTLFSHLV